VSQDIRELLKALQQFKDSPAYNVKAVLYWLRDLEMEEYIQKFAKHLMVNFIESLTILTDQQIHRLVDNTTYRSKMKTAVREMREFRFYHTATQNLLQEMIMEKYAQVFINHGLSIDLIPYLTNTQLTDMGITDPTERIRIIEAAQKLRDVPTGEKALQLLSNNENKTKKLTVNSRLIADPFPKK